MSKLLMISGDRAFAQGKRGAFYSTLEEFHKYWERIDIIVPKIETRDKRQETNFFNNVYVHSSPWPIIFQPWFILRKGLEIFKQNRFDLVTVQEYAPLYNGWGARMLWHKIKIPYILEIHHVTGYPKPASLKERFYFWLFRTFIKSDSSKATKIRIVNQNETPDFLVKCGIAREKIAYMPSLYIDLDIFKPMGLDKKYDLIFVGRLAENKGIDLFLKAVKEIDAEAIIVGSGSLEKKLKTISHKLKANVIFHGWAKDSREVAELMNQSKLLVMPSYSEGGPRVVLEAMACGVPVLATRVGIVPDLEKTGALEIIGWNTGDISRKAKKLLTNDVRYGQLSKLGAQTAKQFEKRSAIENYASKLKAVLD